MKVQTVSYKRSLLIGMLLGDAHLRKRNKRGGVLSANFTVSHSSGQADLVEWKAAEIERNFNVKLNVYNRVYKERGYSTFSFTQGKRLRVIHDWFYKNSRKCISKKIRFMNHPIGMAMLLCDDGSIRRRKKQHKDGTTYFLAPLITVATHCYNEEEVALLLEHIKQLCGAAGYITPERRIRGGKKVSGNRINFNAENSRILWNYVADWIPRVPSMLKKFSFIIERCELNKTASA